MNLAWKETVSALIGATGLIASGVGCATVDATADYQRVREHVAAATGQSTLYKPADDALVAERVATLLADGVTVDEAVQVALLNNPRFQASCMDVGLARADLVQSGLLTNPTVGMSMRMPSGGGLVNIEASIAQNIADLWQLPVRKQVARQALDQAILTLAAQASTLAADAKRAYFTAVGADRVLAITQENLDTAGHVLELTIARRDAGAGNELDVNLSRSLVLEAELTRTTARLAAANAHRNLATLMGLTRRSDDVNLIDPLPDALASTLDDEHLLAFAREHRLDVRSAETAITVADAQLEQAWQNVFPNLTLGFELERNSRRRQRGRSLLADTARASAAAGTLTGPGFQPQSNRSNSPIAILGPSLSATLPLFDQNQAQIAKAEIDVRRARKTYEAVERAVTQEVIGAIDQARTAWQLAALYRDRYLPLAERSLELSRESYQAGEAPFLSVLEAQQFLLGARRRHVEAVQAAAVTIPAIERTVGRPWHEMLGEKPATGEPTEPLSVDEGK